MPTSIAEAILQGAPYLRKAGVPEARREAGSLLAHVIGRDRTFILSHADEQISEAQLQEFRRTLDLRAGGQPLQYITGHQEFFGLDFEVTSDVLIPRPETELLVKEALEALTRRGKLDAPLIADIGTGSGCIAVALAHAWPGAVAYATDFSAGALRQARSNAARHGVEARIQFIEGDLFAALQGMGLEGRLDVILSNPPYIPDGDMSGLQREVTREPRLALAGGPDGLVVHRRLLQEAGPYLASGGRLIVEMGQGQAEPLRQMAGELGWSVARTIRDHADIERVLVLQKS